MASDALDDEEDLMASVRRSDSEEVEDKVDNDEDGSEDADDEDGDEEGDGYDLSKSGITERSEEMRKELAKIQQDEKELLQSMSKSATDDVEKGMHVKAQMSLWETLLDTRIRLQKPVSLVNTFPQPDTYDDFMINDSAESLEESKHQLRSLIDTLITVRTSLLGNLHDVTIPKSNKHDDGWESKVWKEMEALDDAWIPYRNNTLDKWSNKVQIASGIPLNKKFKAMNQGIITQISQTMADKDRLVKRTQLKRSEYHILGSALQGKDDDEDMEDTKEKTPATNQLDAHLSNHDQEIFDDADFYQQLLRELIESRMVDNDDPTAMGMRYHVHEKLQSFMAPITVGWWHEEMVDELFSSLLGRKGDGLNDDDDAETKEDEQDEEEQFEDDGLRIFG
ncbi:apoptosis antagonizing transcription factor-domain-containing protein [Mortierella sp. GBAus27b]|nr:apoptosis antagonizing transcription factor-domain-containing protein [Mortierella sp. GBAus27b]